MAFDPRKVLQEIDEPPQLMEGETQWCVKLLRRLLAMFEYGPAGWLDPATDLSAEFDNDLTILVSAFQMRCGLDPTGVVDDDTWQAFLTAKQPDPPAPQPVVSGRPALERRIVEVALAAEARHIREKPGNRGATVEMIQRHAGGGSGIPWCVAFAWAVVDLAYFLDQSMPPKLGTAQKVSSSALVKWAREHDRLITDPAEARPGDLIVLKGGDTGFFHTALIVASPSGGSVATVEGNTNTGGSSDGDGIYARRRKVGSEHCVFVRL